MGPSPTGSARRNQDRCRRWSFGPNPGLPSRYTGPGGQAQRVWSWHGSNDAIGGQLSRGGVHSVTVDPVMAPVGSVQEISRPGDLELGAGVPLGTTFGGMGEAAARLVNSEAGRPRGFPAAAIQVITFGCQWWRHSELLGLLMTSERVPVNCPAEMSHSRHGECDTDGKRADEAPGSEQLVGGAYHYGSGN